MTINYEEMPSAWKQYHKWWCRVKDNSLDSRSGGSSYSDNKPSGEIFWRDLFASGLHHYVYAIRQNRYEIEVMIAGKRVWKKLNPYCSHEELRDFKKSLSQNPTKWVMCEEIYGNRYPKQVAGAKKVYWYMAGERRVRFNNGDDAARHRLEHIAKMQKNAFGETFTG